MLKLIFKLGLSISIGLVFSAVYANTSDPFEKFNRQAHQFNHDMDVCFFKPIAETYKKITPWFVRDAITNFFSNLNEIPTVANDLLQVNPKQAINDGGRFVINSTFGLGGLVDVASHMRIKHHIQDFGLTLARWGWKDSAFLVLPILGPRTLRDTAGLPVNYFILSVNNYIHPTWIGYTMTGVDKLNMRANYLGIEDLISVAALDQYVFVRDAYLQKRQELIHHNDGIEGESIADIAAIGLNNSHHETTDEQKTD